MDIPAEVTRFRDLAREYCSWAQNPQNDGRDDVETALRLISSLYHSALSLPGTGPSQLEHEDLLDKVDVKNVYECLQERLPFQYYFDIFNPVTSEPEEAVVGDVADDLLDVYVDLKNGLTYFDRGEPTNAVFYWHFSFGSHWGRHATSALKALHAYAVDN